jgi:hypothetical protein
MNLYLISQDFNNGHDSYDSAVVCAKNEEAASKIPPNGGDAWPEWGWASHPSQVQVQYLGVAGPSIQAGVICASFNAG